MTADDNHYPGPDLGSIVSTIVTVVLAYGLVSVALYLVLS